MTPLDAVELSSRIVPPIRSRQLTGYTSRDLVQFLRDSSVVESVRPPFPDGTHYLYGDAIYELSYDIRGQGPATQYSMLINPVQETATPDDTVQFAALPSVDQAQFRKIGVADGDTDGVSAEFCYADDERQRSVLVSGPEYSYISWDDSTVVAVRIVRIGAVTIKRFVYTPTRIGTIAEYDSRLRARFTFSLSGLGEDARAIVRRAVSEDAVSVATDSTPSPAFMSVVDRFRGNPNVQPLDTRPKTQLGGPYLAKFDGVSFWSVLHPPP